MRLLLFHKEEEMTGRRENGREAEKKKEEIDRCEERKWRGENDTDREMERCDLEKKVKCLLYLKI